MTNHDIIQIKPDPEVPTCFHGCLAYVAKVMPYGVRALVLIPDERDRAADLVYVLLPFKAYTVVGKVRQVPAPDDGGPLAAA